MTALAQQRPRGGLRDAVRAEWTKFRTVRGWLVGLGLAALLLVLFSYLQAHGKHTGYCTTPNPNSCVAGHPYVPNGPGGEAVADALRAGGQAVDRRRHDHRPGQLADRPDLGGAEQRGAVTRPTRVPGWRDGRRPD